MTGGEPTIHRGLPGLLRTIREAGYKTKLDTNGTEPEVLEHLFEHDLLDFVAMDIKAPLNETVYERCAGVFVPVSIIERSIKVLAAAGVPHLFRCTFVPSLLAEDDIYRLAEGLKTLVAPHGPPILILENFDPTDPLEPALKEIEPLSKETLSRIQGRTNRILG
jgi:pyruvate formate lyase activating enzyme